MVMDVRQKVMSVKKVSSANDLPQLFALVQGEDDVGAPGGCVLTASHQ